MPIHNNVLDYNNIVMVSSLYNLNKRKKKTMTQADEDQNADTMMDYLEDRKSDTDFDFLFEERE